MSQAVLDRLAIAFGDGVLETSDRLGDFEAVVEPGKWQEVAQLLRDDTDLGMDHFIDLTAIDHPERGKLRYDLVLMVRSSGTGSRIRIRTRVEEGQAVASLNEVWPAANWAEREIWDMFGVSFSDHPDLRRILMYEEFEGHPLRKDYPIDRAQPLVPYRAVEEIDKLPPFGIEEGQPFARIDWEARLKGKDNQVSPSIGVQVGQRRTLSDSEAAIQIQERLAAAKAAAQTDEPTHDRAAEGSDEPAPPTAGE